MGYRLNRLDEPVFMAGTKPMRTKFGIHPRLESCVNEPMGRVSARTKAFVFPEFPKQCYYCL